VSAVSGGLIAVLAIAGLVGILFPALWFVAGYNALVRLQNHCTESWSDIDTELKRRHDLVSNLVATVQGYAAHERGVFERVAQARSAAQSARGSPSAVGRDESALTGGLRQLFAVAEGYPQLKASESYVALQKELANTEDRIQRARRFYNANVRDFNTRIDVVPSRFIAGSCNFQRREYFELESATERAVPEVRA